jgi:hypothetical protein
MVKSENSKDKYRSGIAKHNISEFEKLISGHRKLLEAIGKM